MSAPFTSGPWTVGRMDTAVIGGFTVNRFSISGGGLAIASVWGGDPAHARLSNMVEVGRANAKLIAASPKMALAIGELLAGLQRLGFGTDEEINGGDVVDLVNDHYHDLVDALNLAGVKVRS